MRRHLAPALAATLAFAVAPAAAQTGPVYPKRVEIQQGPLLFPIPLPLQAYLEYGWINTEVNDSAVPSTANRHGVAAGIDYLLSPRLLGGWRFDYGRAHDNGTIANGDRFATTADNYGASFYLAGLIAPPFFGAGAHFGFDRGIGRTHSPALPNRADRTWRYFFTPYLSFAYPIGDVQIGASPALTFRWDHLRFRGDPGNGRDDRNIDATLRLSVEWQATQRLGFTLAATPTWVLDTPSSANLPGRDRFSMNIEAGLRLRATDHVSIYARYERRVFESRFETQGVVAGIAHSFIPLRALPTPPDGRRPGG
jgi:hypothetical protein